MSEPTRDDRAEREIESLRQENARLRAALEELRSMEPEEIIRAIREGEVDALVVQEEGEEQIYSLQTFDSAYRSMVEECFPFGVWLAEPDGKLLYVSPSFLELFETDVREMRQKGQFHFLPHGDPRGDRAGVERGPASPARPSTSNTPTDSPTDPSGPSGPAASWRGAGRPALLGRRQHRRDRAEEDQGGAAPAGRDPAPAGRGPAGGRPPQGRVPGDAGPRAAQPAGPDPQRPAHPAACPTSTAAAVPPGQAR